MLEKIIQKNTEKSEISEQLKGCFSCCVFSISYAMMSGRMKRLKEILYSLSVGLTYAAPWFLIYVLGAELYFSIRFVFMMG